MTLLKRLKDSARNSKYRRFTEADMERPEHGNVNIFVAVRDIRVHFFIAVRVRRLHREGACIEPLRRSLEIGPFVRVADHVHPLLEAAANVLRVGAGGYRVRQPGTELDNAIERPSAAARILFGLLEDLPNGDCSVNAAENALFWLVSEVP